MLTAHSAIFSQATRIAPSSRHVGRAYAAPPTRAAVGGDSWRVAVAQKVLSIGAAALVCLSPALEAQANEKIGEFATSGFIPIPGVFRDTVQVDRLIDPGVEGVTLYYTDYSRSLAEKFSSDPFADPSQASIACVATGRVVIKDVGAAKAEEGQEIFSELKTLNLLQNKRLRVRRIYDEPNGALIYVTYSTRNTSSAEEGGISSSRYRTSICAIPVGPQDEPVAP